MSSTVLGRNAVTVNKKYTEYFLPTVLTAMATNIAMIVDSIIAGNLLGQNSLAAINLMSPISQFYFSITILFGLGASSIISFAKGRRDEKQANRVFTSTFIVLIALSVIFIAIQLPLADSISSLLTKDAELKSLLYQYYVPFIIGTPIYLLLMCSIHFVRADARPAFASNIVIVANAINLGLDFLFMGAFKMGIAGSSIATVTGYAVGFVMMSTHFIMKKSTLHFDFSILRNPVQFFKFLGKMVTIGLSGALGTMLITVKMLFLNTIIQSIGGSAGMVSYSVCSSSQIFMSMFITGASQTMIPIIGVCLGEKDYDDLAAYECKAENTFVRPFKVSERYPNMKKTITQVKKWWKTHVEGGVSPKYDEKADADILKVLRDNNLSPDSDLDAMVKEAEGLMIHIEEVNATIADDEKRLKKLKELIKEASMSQFKPGDKTVTITGGSYDFVTTVSMNKKQDFDTEAMEKDGVLDKYMTENEKPDYRLVPKRKELA